MQTINKGGYMKIYKALAQKAYSRLRCIDSINKFPDHDNVKTWKIWIDRYEDEIDDIMKNIFPHGSGVDNGCSFNYDKSCNNRLIINSGYHCMDEHGHYDGWVDFTVTLIPDLELDYKLKIKGNFGKYSHVKEYLYQIFHDSFDQEVNK